MAKSYTILLLEDEPLILMDLEFAVSDHGSQALTATTCAAALNLIAHQGEAIDLAVLDVSLGGGSTCFPVAQQLDSLNIPYILHSGDLDRHNERIRELTAERIAKPAAAEQVIAAAIAYSEGTGPHASKIAAE